MRRAELALLAPLLVLFAGCGAITSRSGLQIVAAENFWGSLAKQIAGSEASAHSIIVDPAQDPHSYEPPAADARRLAAAQLVVVNGVG